MKADINAVTILGHKPCHPTPKEAITHADSVVIGEAEESWPQLLHDLEEGKLQPFYQQTNQTDTLLVPPPDNSLISRYWLQGAVRSSIGCPYACKFCFIGNSKDGKVFRKRPMEHVVQEIRNDEHRIITFYDSSMTIDVEYTKSLFRALRGLHKNFICIGNVNVLAKDDELLRLSKEAGCIQWNVGFESISQESLKDAKKKTNVVNEYKKAIEKIHAYNMNVRAAFIFGFDHDTIESFDNTWNFIQQSQIDSVYFSLLTPLPNTPLFKDLKEQHRIFITDWGVYGFDQTVVFHPKILTETELLDGYKKIYKNFYSLPAVAKRFYYLVRRKMTASHLMNFLIDNVFVRAYFLYYVCRKK